MKVQYRHELFVDREEEMRSIFDIVTTLLNGGHLSEVERVRHVCGQSRIGKSWFLQECQERLTNEFGTFSLFLNLEYFATQEPGFTSSILRYIDDAVCKTLNVISPFMGTDNQDLHNYNGWVRRIVKQVQDSGVVVFFFDELSLLSDEQIDALEDYLLGDLLYEPRVILVLAGRSPVSGWKEFGLRPFERNTLELSVFDPENTGWQLQNHRPGSEHLVEKIHAWSGGSPGDNDTILALAEGDPLDIKEPLRAIQACNQPLRDALKSTCDKMKLPDGTASQLLLALEALCVTEDFDKEEEAPVLLMAHEKLGGTWDQSRLITLFNTLNTVNVGPGPLIRLNPDSGSFMIEPKIRASLEKELELREVKLWRRLHCTAMNMFQKWAGDYKAKIYETKANYHRNKLKDSGFDPAKCQAEVQEAHP